ncbi:energy transducer TonB [Hymenobacter cellulosilyticus]|uniref:Energy transducer TonB n=1 Tax=Hymenobacter cellulosilyticus TaxID=2932248 RepID=A0A8T9QA67_9BACT|nr:energy transducer TonB [Hymenobacter cellulosilyticus]UOQ73028.1 energy transducer TonB [Hymenobacter cellulosilyticus]
MLRLPILNVRLAPCSVAPEQLTPTAQGHFCRSCDREVIDFTSGTQADLDAARAASPDGRLCGRFRAEQLATTPRVQLRPKLRRFVVALVLVCGLGLTCGEAWAQLQKTELATRIKFATQLQLKTPEELSPLALRENEAQPLAPLGPLPQSRASIVFGVVAEQMPEFKGGMEGLKAYLKRNLHYPDSTTASGKVFVGFLVTRTGAIANARILKSVDPLLDAEALRVVRQMPAWKPGRQNRLPTEVSYTLPITFSRQ